MRNEYPTLIAKYPVTQAFDELFAAETRRTRVVDPAFWQYSLDEKKLGATAAAEVLAEQDRYPFGYENEKVVYTRNAFWALQAAALSAPPAARDAWLAKLATFDGKTRFDSYSSGLAALNLTQDPKIGRAHV